MLGLKRIRKERITDTWQLAESEENKIGLTIKKSAIVHLVNMYFSTGCGAKISTGGQNPTAYVEHRRTAG